MRSKSSENKNANRLRREQHTIQVMAQIYCSEQHQTSTGLCPDCHGLLTYAMERLDRCVYQEQKPTCANCPIHCYKKELRERVRVMMRYVGPRMFFSHPLLSILHLVDGRRKAPQPPPRRGGAPTD